MLLSTAYRQANHWFIRHQGAMPVNIACHGLTFSRSSASSFSAAAAVIVRLKFHNAFSGWNWVRAC
jgi:hypothetical protein